jgi:hypothetical protein
MDLVKYMMFSTYNFLLLAEVHKVQKKLQN